MKALYILTKTELKLSFREFSGVLFGLLLPLGLMIFLGVIYGNKPAYDGAGFLLMQQAFPAVICIGIIASGLMGVPLTISEYRDKKILKRFKVTPTSPLTILLAQGINALVFSTVSAFLVWLAAKLFFGYKMIGSFIEFIGYYLITLISIYALGFLVASISKTVKQSNLLTSLLYFPMFFVSGATVPYEILPKGLQIFADIMPLTHGIKLLKASSLSLPLESGLISIIYLCVLAVVCTIISIKTFRWE